MISELVVKDAQGYSIYESMTFLFTCYDGIYRLSLPITLYHQDMCLWSRCPQSLGKVQFSIQNTACFPFSMQQLIASSSC